MRDVVHRRLCACLLAHWQPWVYLASCLAVKYRHCAVSGYVALLSASVAGVRESVMSTNTSLLASLSSSFL